MFPRLFNHPELKSFFLFGLHGTGKTFYLKHHFPKARYIDLLDDRIYRELLAAPERIES